MIDDQDTGPQDELSPAELKAFLALPRELAPPADLEERAVAMMRRAGHLPTPLTVGTSGRGDVRTRKAWWIVGAIAASLAIFASGMSAGYVKAMSDATTIAAASSRNAQEVADRVQRTGDRYIAALASLGQLRDTSDVEGRTRAKETALAVLGAAAQEIANLAPNDPLAAAVLRGLNERSRQSGTEAPSRRVIWY